MLKKAALYLACLFAVASCVAMPACSTPTPGEVVTATLEGVRSGNTDQVSANYSGTLPSMVDGFVKSAGSAESGDSEESRKLREQLGKKFTDFEFTVNDEKMGQS